MTTETHALPLDDDQLRPARRIRFDRKALRRVGLIAAVVALTVLVTGRAEALPDPAPQRSPGCAAPDSGTPSGAKWATEPAMTIDQNATYTATLETNCGTITAELDAARAPHTVNSFVFLSDQGYFDHTRCHRLTTEGIFVLQCGDPTGTGTGGPGYKFVDENLAGASYPAGTIAMANAGPNTNGSQFFLVYRDTRLPANYTPFGRITDGMDALQSIVAAGTQDGSADGKPAADPTLSEVSAAQS
ncbi:peptidylprolyl isomerase [Nocardia sp. NPDC005978]|uniref:peptidylprolyl isomerase n=1 Tax=unclassified Nocardia TaxID=2637762 RepID=UPI0033AB7091